MDIDTVELRDVKYELHRLFTDAVCGEMAHRKKAAIQSMMNRITILKRIGGSAGLASARVGRAQVTTLKASANSVITVGVDSF